MRLIAMKHIRSPKGFTLLELMVASSLFAVIISFAVGALFSAQAVNLRLERTQAVLDGVNLATELMVRDIRYGSVFYCDSGTPSPVTSRRNCPYASGTVGANILVFKPSASLVGSTNNNLDRVAYYLENGIIYKREYPSGAPVRTYQITSNDVTISMLGFYSVGLNSTTGMNDYASATDLNQPLVAIAISGATVARNGTPVTFNLNTSTVSRSLDN